MYVPLQLKLTKENIISQHKQTAKFCLEKDMENEAFIKFLKKIATKKKMDALKYAQKHTPEMISKLAGYLVTNKCNHPYPNFFFILENMATIEDWQIIYEDWQNSYLNNEIRHFLSQAYENCKTFIDFLKEHYQLAKLTWLKSNFPLSKVAKMCNDTDNLTIYKANLLEHGIKGETRLYIDAQRLFLLHCNGAAYISLGDTEVSSTYGVFNESEKLGFLLNFIKKLGIYNLDNFTNTYKIHKRDLYRSFKDKVKTELENLNLYDRYEEWLNRMELKLAFKGDKYRFKFWVNYQKGNKIINFNEDTLCIDFGNYIVIEFKNKASGACYILSKNIFTNQITYWRGYSNQEIKQRLNDLFYANSEVFKRLTHVPSHGGWFYKFRTALISYGIYPSETNN